MNKIGRNDRCPCGSNLKFKNCCLNRANPPAGERTIREILGYLQGGQLLQAQSASSQWLAAEPHHPDALHLGGMVAQRRGEHEEAIDLMNLSIAASPEQPAYRVNLGRLYQELERYDEAIGCYRKAQELDGENAEARNDMGIALKSLGRLEEAADCYREAIAINPRFAIAHYNLGDALKNLGHFNLAKASFKRAFVIDPKLAELLNNAGLSFQRNGRFAQAQACYLDLVGAKPDHVEGWLNLGVLCNELGEREEAISCYRRVLALDPASPQGLNNLGSVLNFQGKYDEALDCFRKALRKNPHLAELHVNMGNSLRSKCRFKDAILSYDKALAIRPGFAEAFSNLLLTYQYADFATNREVFARSVAYGRCYEALPAVREPQLASRDALDGRPIRIGLVSGDFSYHPVGFFLEPALRHLDKASFSLTAYANQLGFDHQSERLRAHLSDWVWVKGLTDAELAARIRADGIDILIDLSGHTGANRLGAFALKPAPVQVSWIGYANTTGMTSIDYILADSITVPESEERFYTEKVWRLPETYLCFTPPDEEVATNELPALENGFLTFGSFHNTAKLNDAVVACWAAILLALPDAQLFFKYKSFALESERDRFRERFQALDVAPERLRFEDESSREEYLAAYRQVDLVLDPFPFPGGTTTCEAAWMGVPTLTLPTARGMVGHNGELIMKTLGLGNWVAQSSEQYVAQALAFAGDPAGLAEIRSGLRRRLLNSPLCDGERFAGHLEAALKGMLIESGTV